MATVMNSETAEPIGTASEGLIKASQVAGPTGHVTAYRDDDGLWHHIPEGEVENYRRNLGATVMRVYVETQ